uniref:BFN domain-containing protein n=1 Tax=Zea mays TaxID=4577 RepID=A0A804MGK1_MAIZE
MDLESNEILAVKQFIVTIILISSAILSILHQLVSSVTPSPVAVAPSRAVRQCPMENRTVSVSTYQRRNVEVRSGSEGYVIKMRDGNNLRCVHSNFQGRNIPESAPQPAIVLRIEDGSRTLLPIIVLEMPSVILMAAIHNVHIA